MSPQIEQILGITPDDWVSNDALWLKHVHPEDRQRVLEEYEAFLAGGPDVDYRMVRSDGKIVWIRDRARLFTDEGGALIEQGVMLDVSEIKEAEAATTHEVELLRKADAIARSFTALLLRGGGLRRILDGLADITHKPVVLEDLNR